MLAGSAKRMIRLLILTALLSGCAGIDYRAGPVPGLEHMTIEQHIVAGTEIYQACSRCGQRGIEPTTACTCINFATNHVVIWLPAGASDAVIEREYAHAHGYDHEGGELRSKYERWKKNSSRIDLTTK
jgi:hypothetical protein